MSLPCVIPALMANPEEPERLALSMCELVSVTRRALACEAVLKAAERSND